MIERAQQRLEFEYFWITTRNNLNQIQGRRIAITGRIDAGPKSGRNRKPPRPATSQNNKASRISNLNPGNSPGISDADNLARTNKNSNHPEDNSDLVNNSRNSDVRSRTGFDARVVR